MKYDWFFLNLWVNLSFKGLTVLCQVKTCFSSQRCLNSVPVCISVKTSNIDMHP